MQNRDYRKSQIIIIRRIRINAPVITIATNKIKSWRKKLPVNYRLQ